MIYQLTKKFIVVMKQFEIANHIVSLVLESFQL